LACIDGKFMIKTINLVFGIRDKKETKKHQKQTDNILAISECPFYQKQDFNDDTHDNITLNSLDNVE